MLLLHLLFVGVTWFEMRPSPLLAPAEHAGQVLQVRFIPRSATLPASVPPPAPTPPARSVAAAQPAHGKGVAPAVSPHPTPAAHARATHTSAPVLFDRTGEPLLPAAAASTPSVPGYVARLPQGDRQVMRHAHPLPYKATRLDKYFPPPDETLLGQGIRRALNRTHTNETKTVNLPHGVHLKCKTLFGIPTPFCQDPPAPPSRKDGDERLDMAPAAPLAKELRPRKPPPLARCIALYRAGKPLPHGCPVDTPERAVDAELAGCIAQYRAGQPLAARCPPNTPDLARRADRGTPARFPSGRDGH